MYMGICKNYMGIVNNNKLCQTESLEFYKINNQIQAFTRAKMLKPKKNYKYETRY